MKLAGKVQIGAFSFQIARKSYIKSFLKMPESEGVLRFMAITQQKAE